MKQIKLTRGLVVLVDDSDYEELSKYKWFASHRLVTDSFCAARNIKISGGKKTLVYMHRQILGLERGDPRQGDHQNHNPLDNRRNNLRICTMQQNLMNRSISSSNKTSRFKGVCWQKSRKKWLVQISIKGVLKTLGRFLVEKDAALAYNKAAKESYGEFACLNQI